MDLDRVITRARNVLLDPLGEWPAIAAERSSVGEVFNPYVLLLAAIPPFAGFVRGSIFRLGRAPLGFFTGLRWAIFGWLVSLLAIWLFSLVIDALAPVYGGTKDRIQAVKTAAFAHTPVWLAGLFYLFGSLGTAVTIVAGLFSIWLLFLALPNTMKAPHDRTVGYTIATVVLGGIVSLALGWLTHGLSPRRHLPPRPPVRAQVGENLPGPSVPDGPAVPAPGVLPPPVPAPGAGAGFKPGPADESPDGTTVLDEFKRRMDAAARKMEQARQSGDATAQRDAVGEAVGTILGGGAKVEALPPEQLRAFVPASLGGLPRTKISVERNGALGMQISTARATYGDGDQALQLEITDMGSVRGLMALAEWASVLHEKETDDSWDRTRKVDGRIVHEKWDSATQSGEYGVVLGERFAVKVTGDVRQVSTLQAALRGIDLEGLEALRNQGVQK
ncbi:MAG: Yip1 family protein [Alphaproteobacteria bacterium]